ncbi:MAG TPA: hypothetical protein VGG41_10505 [Solirubrobacteraceae bacterium]|jgi:hypothetical protein
MAHGPAILRLFPPNVRPAASASGGGAAHNAATPAPASGERSGRGRGV